MKPPECEWRKVTDGEPGEWHDWDWSKQRWPSYVTRNLEYYLGALLDGRTVDWADQEMRPR